MNRLLIFVLVWCLQQTASAASAPAFELKRWGTGEPVRLADFAGQIVVLDFFAYWCVPCHTASKEIEEKIQKHYEARKGNPHGVPVRVVSINVEEGRPKDTEAFIKKHKLSFVLNDADGKTLRAFAGEALPHIVILDGTQSRPNEPVFTAVYTKNTFEGAEALRRVIDQLGSRKKTGASARMPNRPVATTTGERPHDRTRVLLAALAADGPGDAASGRGVTMGGTDGKSKRGWPEVVSRKLDLEAEGIVSSDVNLTQSTLAYGQKYATTEWTFSAAHSSIRLDYRPVAFDFLGTPASVRENRYSAQAGVRRRLGEDLTWLGSGGLYDGFTDYRSAWLAEYYQQQFTGLPNYVLPEPAGQSLGTGLRWEYLPATGFLQADFSFLKDTIAPGYEIDFSGLRRGRDELLTRSFGLTAENILGPRVRVLNEFRLAETTDREPRFSYQGSLNAALGEKWVLRVLGGTATEAPRFDAWYVGGTIEYEPAPAWLVSVSGRYYRDTGEIENSLFSNAAPGLKAWQVGVGLRYLWDTAALKLFAAPYFTRYEPFGIGTAFFANLYRNREWGIVQIAYSLEF